MKSKIKYIKILIIIFVSALVLEVCIFNFRFWESLTFKKVEGYSVSYEAQNIVITDINAKVSNIYFKKTDYADGYPLNLTITYSDEANTDLVLSGTEVINSISESNYLRIYPDGKITKMTITLQEDLKDKVSSDNILLELNTVRPFRLHPVRFGSIFLTLCLLALFMPKSPIYEIKLFGEGYSVSLNKRLSVYAFLLLAALLWIFLSISFQGQPALVYYKLNYVEAIYSFQAEAFLDGHVPLNQTPPSYLSQMENPYDYAKRIELMKQTGESFNLDFAFFDGKYYCYYGIVPVLLFYLPFLAITKMPPNNSFAVIVFGVLYITACLRLVRCLCRRLNKEISLGMYFLLCSTLIVGSGAIYFATTPNIYSIPFISGFAFVVSALVCWFRSTEYKPGNEGHINKLWLIAGSICIGLAVGCRPTFGLFVLFAFPIFAVEIKERRFFSVKGLGNTLCVMLPVFFIGLGLMYYNYIRFGNPVDFGYKYNLCAMDLSHRYSEPRRLLLGTFEYLFQPMNINGTFPYVRSVYDFNSTQTDYLGYLFFDPVYCGYFILSPISLFILFLKKRKSTLKDNGFYYYSIISLFFAAALLLLNIEKTGITMRYQCDFSLFLIIPALMVALDIENSLREKDKKLHNVFVTLIFCCSVYMIGANLILSLGTEKMNPMNVINMNLYYSLKYLFFVPR